MKRLSSKIKITGKDLDRRREEGKKITGVIQKLQSGIQDLSAKLKDLNERSEKLPVLADSQLKEYNKIKENAGVKTSRLSDEKEVLDRQHHADMEALKNMEENLQQLRNRTQELNSQEEETRARLEKILDTCAKQKEEVSGLKRELGMIQDKHQDTKSKQLNLKSKIGEIDKQLRELKADRFENQRDNRLSETAETLKRLFQGVHGRMTDLCRPKHEKYNVAITVAMEDSWMLWWLRMKIQEKNVSNLKHQRLPRMTFIPLESIRIKPIPEWMRTLGGTSKLVKDVIEFDPMVEKAIIYAVGSTMVCDDLDDAKKLGWDDGNGERIRVVTVDGTLLTKSGTMTGGTSGGIEARSRQWNDQKVEGLKKKKEEFESELEELGSLGEIQLRECEASGRISGLEEKIQYAEIEKKCIEEKLNKLEHEKKTIKEDISGLSPGFHKLKDAIEKRGDSISTVEVSINEVVDWIFEDFSRSVGVADIREYEENHLKAAKNVAEEKLSLSNQLWKLNSQLEYEQKRDAAGARIRKVESCLNTIKNELKVSQKKEEELKSTVEKATSEIDTWNEELQGWKSKAEDCDKEIQKWKKQASDATTKISKLNRTISSKKGQIEQLLSRKQNIVEKGELEHISLEEIDDSVVASLKLENEDEPYLQGIKFTAMPPTKRFRDMEQLSGGEKTVAALAFLFAIHSYSPSPFFILDEVDAALDNLNVAKVAGFISENGASGFQSIVISLKDRFYDKAEALIGVYRDADRG